MSVLTINKAKQQDAIAALQKAMTTGTEDEIKQAWEGFHESIAETIKQDFYEADGDKKVLAQRGYRQLTSAEEKFYEKLIESGKSSRPKEAFTDIAAGIMPETIIEDVYKNLLEEHPLLNRINFTSVKYLTKWILNDHTVQSAAWGELEEAVTKEITSAFKSVDISIYKLSAFAVISKDMLDLGPTFIDNYIRTVLKEAIAVALEKAVVDGTGKNQPIGLTRDVSENVVTTGGVHPQKTKIKVTNFLPKSYGTLLAKLAKTEKGRKRKFSKVLFICNQIDYLSKVMPATTVYENGGYTNNIFPFPTDIEISNELNEGEAIICLPEEYFFGIGSSKDGAIEYTDEYRFLEDQRVYKIKMHANGRAYDNTVAIFLDISKLEEYFTTVKVKSDTPAGA